MSAIKSLRRNSHHGRGLIWLIGLVAVVSLSFYAWRQFSGNASGTSLKEQPLTVAAVKAPFDHVVLEQGEIESSSNIDVINEVKSRGSTGTAILWVIEEGAFVKKGDKLIELDSSALEDELKRQRITVSSAEAQVISSQATVRTNEIALQEYLNGTYQSERKAILSEIAVAEQQLRNAELNLDSARRLAAKGMLKGLQIEAEEFSVSNARNVLESAQARLSVLDNLTKEKNRVQLESDIESARAKLSSDQNVLSEEQSKQNEIEDQIRKCNIKSPSDGIVVYYNQRSGRGGSEFIVEPGAIVRERQAIIRLPDPTKMQVKALINESRVVRISAGMPAKIRVSAFSQELLARVLRVNKYAEPGSWFSSSVKQYAAYLEILDPPEAIRTGMSAEVRIFVEQLPDALQIPVHGIYEYRDHHFCLVKRGQQWETREIQIGATNEKMVTILAGLAEKDEVALNPRNFLSLMTLPVLEDPSQKVELAKFTNRELPSGSSAESTVSPESQSPANGQPISSERRGPPGDGSQRREGTGSGQSREEPGRSGPPGGAEAGGQRRERPGQDR
ncbi:MAG: biotin/lipoyl-binding protein [Pirellulaceae bacterium]|nr:biotin/lipoyl-binding protein [Pirellulaceae bacterium]